MAEIAIEHVTKRFPDGTVAVRDACFTVGDGEFFILVGPSGCGKSTLLNMIVGLEEITGGRIRVGGRVVNDMDPKDRNMAMVFQSYAIYPHMSVWENMAFPLQLAKVSKPEIRRRVEEAAEILELADLLAQRPASLSGGQRQRVAMGRAIVRHPDAFLLDEPLSNLDAKLRVQMRTEIARIQRRLGTTTVYVTHDQVEAMTLADRLAVMRDGVVQQIGTPRELYTRPDNLFVAGFIGSPAMNFLPGRIEGTELRLPAARFPLPETVRAQLPPGRREVIAGIRPEHLQAPVPPDSAPEGAACFQAEIEIVEWVGADLYAHFSMPLEQSRGIGPLPELAADRIKDNRLALVARIDPATEAREGSTLTLCFEPRRLALFDPRSGDTVCAGCEWLAASS